MSDPRIDDFNSLPFFTRYWFALSIVLPLCGRFGILSPYYLTLDLTGFITQFQIWRPITAVFYFPLGLNESFAYFLNISFLCTYSAQLETGHFGGRPADYCFLLLFNWLTLVCAGLALNVALLMGPMVFSVLYIWCKINKDVIVLCLMKAKYVPWVLLVFNFILRGGGFEELLGILVGHLYYYLNYLYPEESGRNLLETPQILYHCFPSTRIVGGVPPGSKQALKREGHTSG